MRIRQDRVSVTLQKAIRRVALVFSLPLFTFFHLAALCFCVEFCMALPGNRGIWDTVLFRSMALAEIIFSPRRYGLWYLTEMELLSDRSCVSESEKPCSVASF